MCWERLAVMGETQSLILVAVYPKNLPPRDWQPHWVHPLLGEAAGAPLFIHAESALQRES